MDNKELLKVVGELGFPLMETEEYDFNRVLAEVVQSHNLRLWEGFPVLLRNAYDQKTFNPVESLAYLDGEDCECFWKLFCLSMALYEAFSLSADFGYVGVRSREAFAEEMLKWRNFFMHGGEQEVGDVVVSSDRVKRLFQDYYLSVRAEKEQRKRVTQEEVSLEYALSQVFSPKQKELFRKKLDGKLLTKTEREYYSRVVKKKVMALANEELYRLARLVRES